MIPTPHPKLKFSEAIAARLIHWMIRFLWSTYRVTFSGNEHRLKSQAKNPKGVCAIACWHEHILCTTAGHRGQRLTTMASRSKDGRIAAYTLHQCGFDVTYGSSSRGGKNALQEMIEFVKSGCSAAIAVDGPRGPRHQVKAGIVEIARKCSCDVLPTAWAADRAWRAKSWDRFVIPKPFARVHLCYGPGIPFPDPETENSFVETQFAVGEALIKAEEFAQRQVDGSKTAPVGS